MSAYGAVRLVLKPAGEERAVGFFAKDKPVFITCQNLVYDKPEKSFTLRKDVRIWQEKDVLLAGRFDIVEGTGAVSGRDGVKASFTHKSKDRPAEERLEIGAERMNYLPGQRKLAFEGACGSRPPALHMTSTSLDIRLAEAGGGMESLLARGKVVIVQEGKEGRGEEALYDLERGYGRPHREPRPRGQREGGHGGGQIDFPSGRW